MHPCELQALMVGHRTTDWKKLEEVSTLILSLLTLQHCVLFVRHLE